MISVDEALARILADVGPLAAETVALDAARGRVLAEDVAARRTQPPTALSAMDGYALRADAAAENGARLRVIGESRAGTAFTGSVGDNEAVRIFTGAPMPDGADSVLIQENVERTDQEAITVSDGAPVRRGANVRVAGIDFRRGDVALTAGRALSARDIGLLAAMNVPWVAVRRRPRVAILSTGDELVRPGEPIGPSQIVNAVSPALAAFIEARGAVTIDLGIAPDDHDTLAAMIAGARGADVLVTIGGASVGEHDLVAAALEDQGFSLDFWKIAMRPGKPLMHGHLDRVPVLGLPGNPVSALLCALIYLGPLLGRMGGADDDAPPTMAARLAEPLPANGSRQHYMRAALARGSDGEVTVTPAASQDSSLLSLLSQADALIVRPANAPAAEAGDSVTILPLYTPQAGL